jgi:hypothetical protein
MPNILFVITPILPKRKIIESESTKGGDIIGSVAIILKKLLKGMFVLVIA